MKTTFYAGKKPLAVYKVEIDLCANQVVLSFLVLFSKIVDQVYFVW